ncbi:hypothetical protein BJX99DRAFT_258996 [Aspergillus californicus]
MPRKHRFSRLLDKLTTRGSSGSEDPPSPQLVNSDPNNHDLTLVSKGEEKPAAGHVLEAPPKLVLETSTQPVDSGDRQRDVESIAHQKWADIPLQDLGIGNLWGEAYQLFCEENKELVEFYERSLLEAGDQAGGGNDQKQLETLVHRKLEDVQTRQWTVMFGGKEIVVRDQVRRVVHTIIAAKDVISATIAAEPHAAVAWAGILVLLPFLVNPVAQGEDAAEGLEAISDLLVRKSEEHQRLAASLQKKTIELYFLILKYQVLLAKQYSRSGVFRYLRDLVVADDWLTMLSRIQVIKGTINEDLEAFSQGALKDIDNRAQALQEGQKVIVEKLLETNHKVENLHQLELLKTLNTAPRAAFNGYEEGPKSRCLKGTQLEILHKIQAWSEDPASEPLLWLQGMAGTGKSTIARTVASAFHERLSLTTHHPLPDEVCLGASFFFSRTDAERNHARHFFPTLARQLTESLPQLRESICETIEQHHDISSRIPASQWKELILKPLMKLGRRQLSRLTVIVVIDALDECQSSSREFEHDISVILSLFPEAADLGAIRLRAFFTSRADWAVKSWFATMPQTHHCDLLLPKITVPEAAPLEKDDITLFVEDRLPVIRNMHLLGPEWPGKEKVQRLVMKAEGLFIYASTACLFLQGSRRMDPELVDGRLKRLLDDNTGTHSAQASLDNMYTRILQASLPPDADDGELRKISNDFKYIVGSIINITEPLPVLMLSQLLGTPVNTVNTVLESLHAVLSVPKCPEESLKLLHLSFRDFLLDGTRCREDKFRIQAKESHQILFDRCLYTMFTALRGDICDLKRVNARFEHVPQSVIQQALPLHVQYACSYWFDHLRASDTVVSDGGDLCEFLKSHLIHWIEAMALLGKSPHCTRMLNDLGDYLAGMPAEDIQQLKGIVYDAQRFLLSFGSIIAAAPLQIYVSALFFAPKDSMTRRFFNQEIPEWITGLHGIPNRWSRLLKALKLQCFLSIEFSPDSKILVTQGVAEAHLWDTVTWARLTEVHLNMVSSSTPIKMSFSPDSSMLAFPNPDASIGILQLSTLKIEIFPSTKGFAEQVVFSPDGKLIVSATYQGGEIKIFNVQDKRLMSRISGDFTTISSMRFSPDGSVLSVSHGDFQTTLWDVTTGSLRQTITGGGYHHSLAFIADGSAWRTATSSGKLQTLDPATGAIISSHEVGHKESVLLSTDGTLLAAFSKDGQLEIWDAHTARLLTSVQCARPFPNKIMWWMPGPGRKSVVLASDKDIRFWNTESEAWSTTLDVPPYMRNVGLSPDRKLIATDGTWDHLYIWDGDTPALHDSDTRAKGALQCLEASNGLLAVLYRSPCILRMIKTVDDGEWMDTLVQVLPGDTTKGNFAISASGQHIVFGTWKDQVFVWDLRKNEEVFRTAKTSLYSWTISPDGSLVGFVNTIWDDDSESDDDLLHAEIWDIQTGKIVNVFEEIGQDAECVLAISPNNELIAWSCKGSPYVGVRKVQTGELVQSFRHDCDVLDLTFSPDNRTLVAAGASTGLYDVDTWASRGAIPGAQIGRVRFSNDSKYLYTDKGRFDIGPILLGSASKGEGLYVDGDWIMEGGVELILLPVEYRTGHASTWKNTISVANASGDVVTIGFDEGADRIQSCLRLNIDCLGIDGSQPQRVLNYACGNGIVPSPIFPTATFQGIAIATSQVRRYNDKAGKLLGESHGRMFAIQGDLYDPQPVLNQDWTDFDTCIISFALHHTKDPVDMLTRLRQRLRKGGTLVIVDFLRLAV